MDGGQVYGRFFLDFNVEATLPTMSISSLALYVL